MALIYHYCSPYTFLQIIERRCIWLSSTNNMNDSSEGRWYLDLVEETVREHEGELGKKWSEYIQGTFESHVRPSYIACFSTEKDLLSQWRAYADNGSGVAIGFEMDSLPKTYLQPKEAFGRVSNEVVSQFRITDVKYDDKESLKEKIIARALFWRSPDAPVEFVSPEGLNDYVRCSWFNMESERLSTDHKNPAFAEEKEKRIIYTPDYNDWINPIRQENFDIKKSSLSSVLGGMKHRISDGFLTSYFEYPFPPEAIKQVVLGPKNKFTESDLKDFLLLKDMRHVEIEHSAATYR
ncbi:DUF2971 domain-containing protein [Serratia marcescens]|uniref:DUF2971 domain-containing protein n=1 Tax=Serratia marcescens TaxID=615 RepID=UPI0013D928AF|nr:DUF2971 domain-containing protein [Serratia marcescens]MDU7467395.1 DUF2971 domain-containing protein [Serratia marcescens]HEJ7090221.1 DUF2971 domain-containing protein [Serratia marcescens]